MNKYRSKYEKRFAKNCERPFTYESLDIVYQPKPRTYKPDFIFQKKDGGTMAIELKGVLTVQDRTKLKCVIEQHPELDLRIIFQRAENKIRKGSNTSYSDWAEKEGIPWAEGDILPTAWLKEIAK